MGHALTSVGGFPTWHDLSHPGLDVGHWAYSASHALRDYFKHQGVRVVWLPAFYCPDTVDFLALDFSVRRYAAAQPARPEIPVVAQAGDGIVLYPPLGQTTGCRWPALAALRERGLQAVLDLVHDLHAAPHWHAQGWNTVVSFRKFYPVPCGARLLSEALSPNADQLERAVPDSELDAACLTLRQPRTEGYARFKQHEAQLHRPEATLPAWVPKLVASLDEAAFRQARQTAYQGLHQQLGPINQFFEATDCAPALGQAPIAYPFYQAGLDSAALRQRLAGEGIFIPHFWPGLAPVPGPSPWQDSLLLPTGPLLGASQLDRLVAQLRALLPTFTKDSP
ncbi:hypothetical protein PSQ40_16175 [Curvibacter sp. HBC61]|uniref:DegT/DnrJ/EryC1/StrS aminotransferase family protein n=1 Tax=Curvibacter cyanobacteriorum TaxID=3026422 RepID=A0ABT5N1D3_9BURK|nr:hypothetical protein [Curvibacter sp. HBC61]MDD0840123.1 hypothetical protein [Curvibacter sp. HBC61]